MKKFLILILTLLLSVLLSKNCEKMNEKTLYCDENGNFTILVVADPQCDTKQQWYEARNELEILISKSNPQFVIINGDMNSKNYIPKDMWDIFIYPIEKRNIFWATTNGNHDPFVKKYYKMYKEYDGCLNVTVNTGSIYYEQKRPMNYVIPIYSNDKNKIVFAIYGMDTGKSNEYGYEGLTKKQIDWYKNQSNTLKKRNKNIAITSLMCLHIPITQTIDMFYSSKQKIATPKISGENYTVFGVTNQQGSAVKNYVCESGTLVKESYIHTTAAKNDRGIFDAVLKQQDVKIMVFGHEHNTNIIGSYKGVLLGFAGKISTGCYSDIYCRGGRIIKFNEKNPQNFISSWIGTMPTSVDQVAIYSDGTIAD